MQRAAVMRFLERATLASVYGLIFFTPFGNAGIEIAIGLAVLFFVARKVILPDFNFLLTRLHFFLGLFLIFSGLSLINSGPYLKISVYALLFKWVEYALVFVIVEDTLVTRQRIRRAVMIMLGVSLAVGLDAVYQQIFGVDFLRFRHTIIKQGQHYLTACFNHHNDFGAYIGLILILTLALLQERGRARRSVVALVLLAGLSAYGLLFSLSRGAWFGFLSAGTVLLIFSRHKRLFLVAIAALLVFIFSNAAFWERVMFTLGPRGDHSRFVLWRAGLAMAASHPFLGSGAGTFMAHFSRLVPDMEVQYAHNSYLQILVETGVLSLISFAGFLVCLLRRGWQALRISKDLLLLGLFCALAGFLVHSFFDTHFYSLRLSVLFWSTAAMLVNLSALEAGKTVTGGAGT